MKHSQCKMSRSLPWSGQQFRISRIRKTKFKMMTYQSVNPNKPNIFKTWTSSEVRIVWIWAVRQLYNSKIRLSIE